MAWWSPQEDAQLEDDMRWWDKKKTKISASLTPYNLKE